MADIQKLTYPYFTDNETRLEANTLNPIIAKINEVIDKVNGGVTPTVVATPVISISGTTATITCSTSGATIYYTTNGNTPTTSSTQYSSPITLSGACTIKAIATKSGMTNSAVKSVDYNPSISPEAQAALAKFSNLSSAQQTKVKNMVDTLVSAGIYSKIHYLSLPLVAGTVPEGLQNILSTETPPTIEFGTISNGLKFNDKGTVDLTGTINGTVDYDAISIALAIDRDTTATGNTTRAIVCNHTSGQSNSSRVWDDISNTRFAYKGYDGQKNIAVDANNEAVIIVSHDKTNSVEKYCYDGTGKITSSEDSVTPTNDGLVLSSTSSQASSSYNGWFSGTYKFVMLADTLTDAQISALNTAIRTFLA